MPIMFLQCPRVQHSLLFGQDLLVQTTGLGDVLQEPQSFCPVVLAASPPYHLHLLPGRFSSSQLPLCQKCHCYSQSWLEAGGGTDDVSQSFSLIIYDSSH